jgi:hypothetical protein
MPEILTIAVCICNEVTFSDFITPMEILSFVNSAHDKGSPIAAVAGPGLEAKYLLQFEYLAPTMNPVAGFSPLSSLPTLNPTQTYTAALQSGKQYDIIWVPAGKYCIHYWSDERLNYWSPPPLGPIPDLATGADRTPQEEIEFIKRQAPGAKYVMSVCGGSVPLATAGILDGKRATTNKMLFKMISVRFTFLVFDTNVWIALMIPSYRPSRAKK